MKLLLPFLFLSLAAAGQREIDTSRRSAFTSGTITYCVMTKTGYREFDSSYTREHWIESMYIDALKKINRLKSENSMLKSQIKIYEYGMKSLERIHNQFLNDIQKAIKK